MGQLYQQIAEQLNDMIPSEWTKIILYAELNDSSEVYFFFNTPQSGEYIYSHDIPKQFDVSKQIYVSLLIELQELFEELREEFKANNQDIWTHLTFKLENTRKFSIDYDYTDVIASDLNGSQRQVVWEYKNLGILPEDKKDKDFVLNYFSL
ncbi:antitoxin YezG family protein [Bacillus halotolerans]|uniref:antitoxin YezG family protein n=1 Tax=Bacillus halotolerans TaxID=260554 RepID=UPI001C0EC46A|nr:antitoxin YezG family protein [Bacillus halotolerans]MBU5247232.1 antitoxin YezG family protein [Bacillus halotolerans]MEC1600811.1 antitoxin YezG family protein [Bacillus halotolerans]